MTAIVLASALAVLGIFLIFKPKSKRVVIELESLDPRGIIDDDEVR